MEIHLYIRAHVFSVKGGLVAMEVITNFRRRASLNALQNCSPSISDYSGRCSPSLILTDKMWETRKSTPDIEDCLRIELAHWLCKASLGTLELLYPQTNTLKSSSYTHTHTHPKCLVSITKTRTKQGSLAKCASQKVVSKTLDSDFLCPER